MSAHNSGDFLSDIKSCGKSGYVLCRYSALSPLQSFAIRFIHMSENGRFLCISTRSTGASSEAKEAEGLLSPVWNRAFVQIQISCEDIDSISEYTGVTPNVASEYMFGLQGEGRPSNQSNRICNSSGRGDSNPRRPVEEQVWSLLFTSVSERDEWKAVLLRGLTLRLQQQQEQEAARKDETTAPCMTGAPHTPLLRGIDGGLTRLAQQMFRKLTISDRFLHNIKYTNCFVGGEAIAFIMKSRSCNEENALKIALQMTSLGWVHSVTYEHFLRNEFLFYQFAEDMFSSTKAEDGMRMGEAVGSRSSVENFREGGGSAVGVLGGLENIADKAAYLQGLVDHLQAQARQNQMIIRALEEDKLDLEEAVRDVSQQATTEIEALRKNISLMSQWLCVLLATYLCHCVAYSVSYLFYDSSLIITSSYIVDTLIYVLNLSILEHFFRIPSHYFLMKVDPDSHHAPFDTLINKDLGRISLKDGDSSTIVRSNSTDSTSSTTSSLLVAPSDLGDNDDASLTSPPPLSLSLRKSYRTWSVDSGLSGTSGSGAGRGGSDRERRRRLSSESDFGGSEFSSRDAPVPLRYIRGCKGDLEEAENRWSLTLEWRRIHRIDLILREPQEQFWTIKELFPHYLHGRSVRDADGGGAGGYPVQYYQINKIDFAQLKARGVTQDALSRHELFLKEYIFKHVEPNDDEGQMISVLDVRGMGLAEVGGEALELWKIHLSILQSHYVERSHQIYVVNASSMFRMVWKLVKPVISDLTRRKVKIFREGADLSKLQRCVGVHRLPEEYGGTGGKLGSSEEERLLARFVNRLNGVEHNPAKGEP